MTPADLAALRGAVASIARRAGDAILRVYESDFAVTHKDDRSPLTEADLAAHRVIDAALGELDATLPVLSEESAHIPWSQRRGWQRYWLVDPLDGTKEFLARTGEFTINIALIDNHRPVLGMLYLPLERVAYVGIPGLLAQRYSDAGDGTWTTSALTTRSLPIGQPMLVLASRRHSGSHLQACLQWLHEHWGPVSRCHMGSALKFSQMAHGRGISTRGFRPAANGIRRRARRCWRRPGDVYWI